MTKYISQKLLTLTLLIGVVGLTSAAAQVSRKPRNSPPNIVVIVTDDMGYADIGIHGSKDIPTPNIDALARTGIRFTDAYVSGPYCSPTRAGLMTGRYPQRFGYEFNLEMTATHNEFGLPLTETTLADRLKAAGYRTAVFGKWHLGSGEQFHPLARGFGEFFGFQGGMHSYLDPQAASGNPLLEGRTAVAETTYLTDALADHAVDFIKRQASHQFFLYLAFNAPHTPMQAPEKYLARFPNIADTRRRTYAAMISAMDDAIGRTMAALRAEGLEEDTLVIFLNDNGGPTLPGPMVNGSSNVPLRGSKRQTWEGGIRVAFAFHWKGHLPEGKVDGRPIIQLDVLPTALAAAGIKLQPGWHLDGVNLLPFLTGKKSGPPHDALYWRLGDNMAIRKGAWKLVNTHDTRLQAVDPATFDYLAGAELYHLTDDIGETRNLAAHPAKVKELAAAWLQWNKTLAKPRWVPGPPLEAARVRR